MSFQPKQEVPYIDDDGQAAIPWGKAVSLLQSAGSFWLATIDQDGEPHQVPILAV